MSRIVSSVVATILAGAVTFGQSAAAEPAASEVALQGEARQDEALQLEYGTTLALTGDLDGAEVVFSSLLSSGPNGAAAWSNLGNVHLMRGDTEVARDSEFLDTRRRLQAAKDNLRRKMVSNLLSQTYRWFEIHYSPLNATSTEISPVTALLVIETFDNGLQKWFQQRI